MATNLTFFSNGYYPINLVKDEDVQFTRKCLCIMFIVQMGLVWLLRMLSVFYNRFCVNDSQDNKQGDKENEQGIVKFDSGANLAEKIQDNFVNAKMKQKIENHMEETNNVKQKIKVVELRKQNSKDKNQNEPKQNIKQLKLNNRQLFKLRHISQYGQKNLKNYLPTIQHHNKLNKKPSIQNQAYLQSKQQKQLKKENKNIFQFESTNQFLSNNQQQQQQQQQTQTVRESQPDQSSYNDPQVLKRGRQSYMNAFLNIKNIKFTISQFSTVYNLLISHSFIAFAVAHLYFPYLMIAAAAFLHILLITIIIVTNMVNNGNFSKYVTRIIVAIIYLLNLLILGVSIFGIFRSNQQFYNNLSQL